MEVITMMMILTLSMCNAVGTAEVVVKIDKDWPHGLYFKTWLEHHKIKDLEVKRDNSKSPYWTTSVKYDRESIASKKTFQSKIQTIYHDRYPTIRDSSIIPFIKKLKDESLIGFAVLHGAKPDGVSEMYNIEFDHMPPESSYGFGGELYGPAIAISNFDHRSLLWRGCSTGGAPMHPLYKDFMRTRNYQCALYANLKCIHDYEKTLPNDRKVNPTESAFERYKEGIKGLIDLHYDYGMNFNPKYYKAAEKMRPYAKYCEIQKPDFADPADMCKKMSRCDPVKFGSEERYYAIADNIDGELACDEFTIMDGRKRKKINEDLRTHRNLMAGEHDALIKYVDGAHGADLKLWNECCTRGKCDAYKKYIPKP